jgi:small subunit ribosomal protein S20
MPITKSAAKAAVRSQKLRVVNNVFKDAMKTKVKNIVKLYEKGMSIPPEVVQDAYRAIDKAYKAGIIKQNTASRKKSRVARLAHAQTK